MFYSLEDLKKIFVEKSKLGQFNQVINSIIQWVNISGKPTEFPPEAHTHSTSEITGLNEGLVGTKQVDETALGDDKILVYKTASSKLEYEAKPSGATDTDAIHISEAGELDTLTEKSTPINNDIILIEDSADSYNKKKLKISNLPSGGSGFYESGVGKVTDSTVTSNTTLTADSDLTFACYAGKSYFFDMTLLLQFDGDPDFKFTLSFSGTTSKIQYSIGDIQMTTTGVGNTFYAFKTAWNQTITVAQSGGTTVYYANIKINGFFTVTTDGNFNFNWAQNTSSTDAVGVLAGSNILWHETT